MGGARHAVAGCGVQVTRWGTAQVLREDLDQARKLARRIARDGWCSIGAHRNDPVTIGAVLGEGLRLVAERLRASKT